MISAGFYCHVFCPIHGNLLFAFSSVVLANTSSSGSYFLFASLSCMWWGHKSDPCCVIQVNVIYLRCVSSYSGIFKLFYEDRIGWFFVGIKKSVGFCIVVRRENKRVGVILLALEISKPNWVATCRWLTRSFEAFHLFELHVGSVSFVVLRAGRLISLPLLHPLFGRMPCNF